MQMRYQINCSQRPSPKRDRKFLWAGEVTGPEKEFFAPFFNSLLKEHILLKYKHY